MYVCMLVWGQEMTHNEADNEHVLVSDDYSCTVENEHTLFSDTSIFSPLGFAPICWRKSDTILRSAHRRLLTCREILCRDVIVEIL